MDADVEERLRQLGDEAVSLNEEVENAYDEHASFQQKLQTRVKVEELVAKFRELCAGLGEADRMQVDRTVGRRVVDLQRYATRLPAPPSGKPVEKKPESQFWETREGKSSRQPMTIGATPGAPRAGEGPRYRVTGEVDAWCGTCLDMKTHTIAAVVDGLPAQVVCQVCNRSHKYRATVPDKRAPKTAAPTYKPTTVDAESQRKAREKSALLDELRAATNVRAYSPRERYKAGEIIEHPEHGRGKIESVLPRSLMVRFAGGLKPVKIG